MGNTLICSVGLNVSKGELEVQDVLRNSEVNFEFLTDTSNGSSLIMQLGKSRKRFLVISSICKTYNVKTTSPQIQLSGVRKIQQYCSMPDECHPTGVAE